ncbi:sporulation membrane protein YtaF [Peribacillus frigoritolerans]|uniref:sporulation membrane protein YtaF n=1 Tax=Peribacillus castrilensis TaxID=2897690 RepID=UPI00296E5ABD|nr:sporulation membrane protein YtaF [Peribacillus castrilensis]MEC0345987.1 sporulation membrane protein YtaF [Peribacillus castrilensis]
MWLQIIFLAFAVSIDGFGVGLTFGMRKMKIPLRSIGVISFCSALSLGIAMVIGQFISQLISIGAAEKTGGIILIFLGAWMVYQYFKPEKDLKDDRYHEKIIFNFEIKSLGVVINILQKPLNADFDKSGTITGVEALVLGFALSLDAFGAGVGAAMIGISPIILAGCIAVMSSIFIWSGIQSGKLLSNNKVVQHLTFLPGVLLIIIGLFKL